MAEKRCEAALKDKTSLDFKLRPIQDNEYDDMQILIDEQGWGLTPKKFRMLTEKFNGGAYVAATDEGILLGIICLLPTRDEEYVVGNFVVDKRYRGKGVGRKMLMEVQNLHANSSVSLCSVIGAVEFYRKCGFHEVGETVELLFMQINSKDLDGKVVHNSDVDIQPYSPHMFEELCQYDSNQRGYDMSRYLSVVTAVCDKLLVARLKSNGNIVGYAAAIMKATCMIFDGFFADNDEIAVLLYWNILKLLPDQTEVKVQTKRPRLFLKNFGNVIPEKSSHYIRLANGNVSLSPLDKMYNLTDCDFAS